MGVEVVSLCDSVDNKQSNNFAAFQPFWPKFFVSIWVKKFISKFLNSNLSSYLSYFTRNKSGN